MIVGALVLRDQNDWTAVFSTTLGPYPQRRAVGVVATPRLTAGQGAP